jgi:DNA-directed RNA polymerase subunit RPC12/RpoP
MNCWHCGEGLIWGGDHDIDEDETYLFGDYSMVTNLRCPDCDSYVLVYYPREEKDDKQMHS